MESRTENLNQEQLTDYDDRPLRTISELRQLNARDLEAEIAFMVNVICTESSALNQADYLFRLLLLISKYFDDLDHNQEWSTHPPEQAMFFCFIHTTPGTDRYKQFVASLLGEGEPEKQAAPVAAPRPSYKQKQIEIMNLIMPPDKQGAEIEPLLDRMLEAAGQSPGLSA